MVDIPTILTTVGIPPAEIVINAREYDPEKHGPIIAYNPGRPDERRVYLPPAPDDLDPFASTPEAIQAAPDAPETAIDRIPPVLPESPRAAKGNLPSSTERLAVKRHGHRRR